MKKPWQEVQKFYEENPGGLFGGESLEDILDNFLITGISVVDVPTIKMPPMKYRMHKSSGDGDGVVRLKGYQQI